MKYVITHCTLDPEAETNYLGHSCLLFSKFNADNKKLEVIKWLSFYGVPTTAPKDSLIRQFKIYIKMDVDLTGNHGMLRTEEIRRLTLGRGLYGTNFEVTKEKFEFLLQQCQTMIDEQNAAIKEVVDTQGLLGKTPEETRIYPHEHRSRIIYDLEKIKAQEKGRAPRLKPFELKISWGLWGPNLANSSTCKTQIISLLAMVLSKEQIDSLTENGKHPNVPKYSGPKERIYLHSTGPLRTHTKESGEVVHYRDSLDALGLFWTLLPQEIDALSQDTFDLFCIDDDYVDEVKSLLGKLQQLEQLCRDAIVPGEYQKYLNNLVDRVIECYSQFAVIEPKAQDEKISGWRGFGLSLFSIPLNNEQRCLQEKIVDAKLLFNSLYMAIVEDWKIKTQSAPEKKPEEGITFTKSFDENPVEAVAAYFTTEKKKLLCKLIGRSYCSPDEDLGEETSANNDNVAGEGEESAMTLRA